MLFPSTAYDTAYPYYKFKPEDIGEIMVYALVCSRTNTASFK